MFLIFVSFATYSFADDCPFEFRKAKSNPNIIIAYAYSSTIKGVLPKKGVLYIAKEEEYQQSSFGSYTAYTYYIYCTNSSSSIKYFHFTSIFN